MLQGDVVRCFSILLFNIQQTESIESVVMGSSLGKF